MAIIKYILIVIILLFIGSISSKAQSYNVESFNGNIQKIHISPDYINNTLTITCLNDTIHINDFTDIRDDVNILDKRFLEIVYSIRGGSDIHLRRVLLLCVNNNKLLQPLDVDFLSSYDLSTVYNKNADSLKLFDEHSLYQLKLSLIGDNKNNYKLNVNVYDENKSKHSPTTNYVYNKQVILSLDTNLNVFYSTIKDVSKYFTVYDPKTQIENKLYIIGTFPIITLGKKNYYYIKNEWYEENDNNYLVKFSFTSTRKI